MSFTGLANINNKEKVKKLFKEKNEKMKKWKMKSEK